MFVKNNVKVLSIFFALSFFLNVAQEEGVVKDLQTREVLPYVKVVIQGTVKGVTTNEKVEFTISNITLVYAKVLWYILL